MYQGVYNGSPKHEPDLDKVLERSWENNLSKIIITAGSLEESKKALEIAKTDGNYRSDHSSDTGRRCVLCHNVKIVCLIYR